MKNQNVDRRRFLTTLAAGGLVAAVDLPSFGKDDPAVFPQRGKYEQLVISYCHIKAGATKPFSVLHISDTHLTSAYPSENLNRRRQLHVPRPPRPFHLTTAAAGEGGKTMDSRQIYVMYVEP